LGFEKARVLLEDKLIDGVTLGTLDDVSEWTLWAVEPSFGF